MEEVISNQDEHIKSLKELNQTLVEENELLTKYSEELMEQIRLILNQE